MQTSAVRERAGDLPAKPGVYLFEADEGDASGKSEDSPSRPDDAEVDVTDGPVRGSAGDGRVLYVGKAVDLRDRVKSYADPRTARIRQMVNSADRIDVSVTETETQALLLEANLVKRFQPRYNVRLKDDKSYPLVQLTDHEFPRIEITRDPDDGATVFGPYTSMGRVETVEKALRETFGVRGCSDHKFSGRERPCLDYEVGLCTAPCTGEIGEEAYVADVASVRRFLEGEVGVLADPLRREMEAAADAAEFERAANLRDRLRAVEAFHEGGGEAVHAREERSTDVLGVAIEGCDATVARLHSEDGKLVDRERHRLAAPDSEWETSPRSPEGERRVGDRREATEKRAGSGSEAERSEASDSRAGEVRETATREQVEPASKVAELLSAFIPQYYAERELPDALLLSERPADREVVDWLEREGVGVRVPGAGREATLVDLALKNARRQVGRGDESAALARELGLGAASRIEGFDVSHAQGRAVVGSNVCFVGGDAEKRDYRRKKLTDRNDDYATMRELVRWRARRAVEGRDDRPDPDLLLIDGGEGQLRAARDALVEAGWNVPAVALAKEEELVVAPDRVYDWPSDAGHLHLLQRVRDEAHRFAVQYHQQVRDAVDTALDEVRGVGPELRKRLLRRFGSVDGVRSASPEELQAVEGVGAATAETIRTQL